MWLLNTSVPGINSQLPDSPTTRCGWWSVAAGRRWWGRRLPRLSPLRTPACPPCSGLCSSPPSRRCFKGTGCAEPRDDRSPWSCCRCCGCRSTDGLMDGWPLLHARSSAQLNSAGVLGGYAGRGCGRTSLYLDAASSDFYVQAGDGHENALPRSRPSWSARGGHAHETMRAQSCALPATETEILSIKNGSIKPQEYCLPT